jgi:hypothetical protein
MAGRSGSDDVICFPLLNDRNQSSADHQGSTTAGQREQTFTAGMGRAIIGQQQSLALSLKAVMSY